MTTRSLEERRTLYSQELAAYTLRQWTAVRHTMEIQSTRDSLETAVTRALDGVSLGPSSVPNEHAEFRIPHTGAGRQSSVSGRLQERVQAPDNLNINILRCNQASYPKLYRQRK
ncbi:hypothetical protein PAXRUDRAFT_823812 [Paxillus rubicundulus Ve08.2h10]|uniref:Uncharacterized protein n=1 Tax=Paxillus rubicundulus Ve08.2h10 TaxID=930991 RepID=A0A0D0E341_9AGAM|nr:hypothetical protein PAXRUDRAFT_823812 [Paxillus rubicundulus Ve08.2h10]